MAKSKAILPIRRRIEQALEKALSDNAVPAAMNLPPDIDKRKNSDVTAWHIRHAALARFFVAHVAKQYIENHFKNRKGEMVLALEIDETKCEAGHRDTIVYDNVVLDIKVDAGQRRLDKALLRTALMVDLKLSADRADAIIEKATVRGKPPCHLVPTSTA